MFDWYLHLRFSPSLRRRNRSSASNWLTNTSFRCARSSDKKFPVRLWFDKILAS